MAKNIAKVKKQQIEVEEEIEEPILEYNNKTYRSYVSQGLGAPEFLDYQEKQFVAAVDPDKKDQIERTVTKIIRVKAIDYTSKKKERKDYIYYYENWNANDWQGAKLPPVTDHIEGYYYEQDTTPKVERNRIIGYKRSGQHPVYYIPFSKEKVDEIIESSVGTDKETILFTVISGPLSYEFPYEKFVNLSFDELNALLIRPGGPLAAVAEETKTATTTANSLEDMAKKARAANQATTVTKETKSSFDVVVVDKDKEEEDIKLEKSVGIQVENKDTGKEQKSTKKEEQKEETRKIVKPAFGDFKI